MEPLQNPGESRSRYQLRMAGYCFVLCITASLAVFALSPLRSGLSAPLGMVYVVFLGLATLSALMTLSFLVSSGATAIIQSSRLLSNAWWRLTYALKFLLIISMVSFSAYQVFLGIKTGEVALPSRYHPVQVFYAREPVAWCFAIGIWAFCAAAMSHVAWKTFLSRKQPNPSFKADRPDGRRP